ncbi:NAD(P)/FAD-dependent oxidoreductase [Brevundimonas sp. Root1279]|uniref:NAD(P)/FAD-dependent oxidoreductase n=1 Tax=Brevundimonas sp. Root1279 TaxID=1736443 RepID=UPI0006FFE789|nr:TIGR03862 family flavoprotein [Brevundimonas sp. Root1279]KQW78452.1 NAD(FAD)-utilizing dehydrogenase [Brevundimonas sp. Root1279]
MRDPVKTVHVIGAGPAGLMAAERLATAGVSVVVHEAMPSPARKFLMAGRGGLNLSHSEDIAAFAGRYAEAQDAVQPWLERYSPTRLIGWAEGLGQETFVGSSGRVFPKAMKASPLLRAWLARLAGLGVELRARSRWTGRRDGGWVFDTPEGERIERPDAVVLALGGASWPRLGSDGSWTDDLAAAGVQVAPLRPSNVGFDVAWSPVLVEKFAGQPLKNIALSHGGRTVRGEAMLTAYGLEGGAVYALSASLREAIARDGSALLEVDLRPDLSVEALAAKLAKGRGKDSVSNWLRKAAGLSPAAVGLMREIPGPIPEGADKLAKRIKAVRVTLIGVQGLARAISSAGGVKLDQVDDRLMLKALPGVFVAGEMLDWEAPTGGYLLQASFASGVVAAEGVLDWLGEREA